MIGGVRVHGNSIYFFPRKSTSSRVYGLEHPAERVRKVFASAYDRAQANDYYVLESVEHVPV